MTAGKYTHAQVREATLVYFNGDEMATDVWIEKYALRNGHDVTSAIYDELTPADMQERVAREFARIEAKYPNPMSYEEILKLFKRPAHRKHGLGSVVPQGSPLSAIGNPYKIQSLSNCFVVDSPHDSYAGIMYTDEQEAQIMKRRGGVGFDISPIRPKGVPTTNAAGSTDGIGVFMERWAATCREVAQGGRRGALMLTISCFEGSTPILTEDGWQTIKSVVENHYSGLIWTHEGFKPIDGWQDLGDRDVYEIECENGKKITVTADHEFVVKNILTGQEYLKKISDVDSDTEELVFYDVQFDGVT